MTKPKPPSAPPLCPTIYRNHDTLFLDFGTIVLPFIFTEEGLGHAIKHIPNIAGARGGNLTGRGNFTSRLSTTGHIARITRPKQHREIIALPDGMREKAMDVVKRMGKGK